MLINRSIAARMAVFVLVGAGCILGAIIGYSYFAVRRMLMDELKSEAEYMSKSVVNRIETVSRAVEKIVQGMATDLEMNPLSTNDMYHLLDHTLSNNSQIIYGAAIAMEPTRIGVTNDYCAPYVCFENGKQVAKNLGRDNYHYDIWDWFNLPQKLRKPLWCEPYFDEGGGNILMVTYCYPVFKNDEFYAVVTSDVSLEWLSGDLEKISRKIGDAWLISANGTFIAHSSTNLIMNETIFSMAETYPDPIVRKDDRRIGRRMIGKETDFVKFTSPITGQKGWLFFAPVPSTDWSLGVFFSQDRLMECIFDLNKVNLLLGLSGFALLLLVALGIARSITGPLRQLAGATRILAQGDLNGVLPKVSGEDEVAQLAFSFEHMRDDLKKYISELQAATAAKERIESEMRIARGIQMDLVPKTFPGRSEFKMAGILDPAREIGGDFYDYFMPDDRRIFLFIGDVSGKGMPAALFMAVTRTLLKAICRVENNPAVILRRLNGGLVESNDSNMFVTLFCMLVDLQTGECKYSNGGHNPPFVVRSDGAVTPLPLTGGPPVGIMPDMQFGEGSLSLQPGDTLFLYTDGVTEAMDPAGELFGENRTVNELRRIRGGAEEQMVKSMREKLREYAAGAEQSDDITMLVFRFFGKSS